MNKRNKQATARAPYRPQRDNRDNRAPISSGIPHFMRQSPQVQYVTCVWMIVLRDSPYLLEMSRMLVCFGIPLVRLLRVSPVFGDAFRQLLRGGKSSDNEWLARRFPDSRSIPSWMTLSIRFKSTGKIELRFHTRLLVEIIHRYAKRTCPSSSSPALRPAHRFP